MTLPVGLGRGVFSILNSNLGLTLNALAEVKFDPETIGSMEIEPLLQLLQSGEIWLTQAPEIKLNLCINLEPDLLRPAWTFLSQAGELLRGSKIWSDLGFAVLFKGCEFAYSVKDSDSVHLSFSLRSLTGQSASSRTSRLPSSLQGSHEAVPPAGVPRGYLTSVNAFLEYKSKDVNGYASNKVYKSPTSNDDNTQYALVGLPLSQFRYIGLGETVNAMSIKNTAASFASELQDSGEDWTIPLHHDLLQWNGGEGCTQEFNKLLDIGFRSLVTRDPAGSSDTTIEGIPTPLSEVAPPVFSLGYSEAMGQRSQFIPSIAKSMASILQRKARATYRRTSVLDPNAKAEFPSLEEREVADLRTTIKHSLWRMAQKQLYNPNASRNLPPLNSAFILDEELLDYIDEGDNCDSDTLLSIEEEEEYYLGTDEDDIEFCENGINIHSDDNLLDFEYGNQGPAFTTDNIEILLPYTSMTGSYLPASSPPCSHPLHSLPSESEMLTDPVVEESHTDGLHASDDVGMLCEV